MNSNFFIVLLFVLMIFGCAAKKTVEAPDLDIDKDAAYRDALLWVFKLNVNIRDSASGSGSILSILSDGDSVLVLGNENGWYQIKTGDGKAGWIRSDLLGPKELSAFPSAVKFIDDLKEKENIELYFDKKLYHKRIYLSYPLNLYTSQNDVEEKTNDLVKKYQNDVYRGHVTARVLKPDSDEEYLTLEFKGSMNADPVLPIIPFGRIEYVDRKNPAEIKLSYSTPEDITDEKLISTARQLSSKFPISYQRVEITFKNAPFSEKKPCRLWFMEDKNGEDYRIGECN